MLREVPDSSYYDKLARLYLASAARSLLRTYHPGHEIFSGTELDNFFRTSNPPSHWAATSASVEPLRCQALPHDLVFTRNLLNAYQSTATRDTAAYEALLRRQCGNPTIFATNF